MNPLYVSSLLGTCDLPVALDPWGGRCAIGCAYCYVRRRHSGPVPLRAAAAVRRLAGGGRTRDLAWLDWRVPLRLGVGSDPCQPAELESGPTLAALRALGETRWPVVIATKAPHVLERSEYREALAACDAVVQVSAVAAGLDRWEPGASPTVERFAAARRIAERHRVILRAQPWHPELAAALLAVVPRLAPVHGISVAGLLWRGREPSYAERLTGYARLREACRSAGLRFYVGDQDLRELSDEQTCCGIEGLGWTPVEATKDRWRRGGVRYTTSMDAAGTGAAWHVVSQRTVFSRWARSRTFREVAEHVIRR